MTPRDMTQLHDPANGVFGDCYRTCVAMLLGLEQLQVPRFNGPDYDEPGAQVLAMRDWLRRERGLCLIGIQLEAGGRDLGEVLQDLFWCCGPDVHFIASGKTVRGTQHSVVATLDGITHDPHPSRAGLTGPDPENDRFYFEFIGVIPPVSAATEARLRAGGAR